MTEKFISSLHIQKLSHEIQEIRERALINIISKLEHGFVFDNDLARSKELLSKLFEWFLQEPCTKQQLVFSLIKRILKSDSGKTLMNHYGTIPLKQELKRIQTYIEPKYSQHLDEIFQIIDEYQIENIVPPLETDIPLSYRTESNFNTNRIVESTATTIEGFIQQDASANQHNCFQNAPKSETSTTTTSANSPRNYIINPLKWQVLIEPDRHVLQSIENSLKRPPQPSTLLHSADFFSNILLHDFPAEVFLQRPSIVLIFHDLVNNCPSTRVTNSVLNCLLNLTKALQVRINHFNDPCMRDCKENVHSQTNSRCSSPDSRKTASGLSEEESNRPENSHFLKTQQMTFPQYCFLTFQCIFKYLRVKPENMKQSKLKVNQKGVNLSLNLLDELLKLLGVVINKEIWNEESSPLFQDIRKQLNEILIGYGVTLEYFRIEALSDDRNLNHRVAQLCFLHNCANFLDKIVPLDQTGLILPRNFKNALANSLVDVTLVKLYPEVHHVLLEYVESFRVGTDSDSLIKYRETDRVCQSMVSAVEFMKNSKILNALEGIDLAKKAMPSLEFHEDYTFIRQVIELCANKLPLYPDDEELVTKFELVILKLLGHNSKEVKEETYRLCQRRVIAAIGPKLNTSCSGIPGVQILFLLRGKVLIEIACHGLTSDNLQIRNFAEDILIHIIKCKILVSDEIWNKVVEALIMSLPILLCHANKNSSLGRSLINIIDPDTAEALYLPKNEVIKANIHILFGPDISMREEAFSRLCWLLASQTDSKDMLPRLNNLHDKALPNVCQIQRIFDVNKNRNTQHFYQPSSLRQVLDLLRSSNVEPVIRRSALTQTSVMMEDPLLHSTFIENDGLEIVLEVLKSALIERDFQNYPDSVIPAISVLKNICFFQSSVRQDLSTNIEVYFNVLRSLFMYFTEEKLRHDAICLLFLLIFNNFIKGSPSKADFSLPHLVLQKLNVPFSCNSHWEISQYYEASLVDLLTSDRWCLSSLQLQWNSEIFGGFDELVSWKEVNYGDETKIVDILKLTSYDLACLKASSIDYYIKNYLVSIQNGVTHEIVIDAINKLTTYIHLYDISKSKEENFVLYPWESTFTRFLKLLPSSEDDVKLLSNVLQFLKLLVPFYKFSESPFWLSQFLKNRANCLLDLITVESSSSDEFKVLSQDLLTLITACASQEQHFLDYYTYSNPKVIKVELQSWRSVIEIIAKNLKFNDTTHFYNLSYLDSLLSCLVHLTASLGWTDKPGSDPKKILTQMVTSLCELVVVFHCGKGPTAAISVMGLSITRHVLLILNHILAEMHFTKMKNWEMCFIEIEGDWLKSFLVLWSSRDVVVRAGALQLFAGLSVSPRLAINIVNELKNEHRGVWNMALNLLLDHEEASIVKENCAFLLANLTCHASPNLDKSILTGLVPMTMRKGESNVDTIFDLFESHQFYKNLVKILNGLYTINIINFYSKDCNSTNGYDVYIESSSDKSSEIDGASVVTPSFIKSLTNLLLNLLNLDSERLCYKLQDFGLVKLLFRCICNPSMSIHDTKKLSLYCEILEMDTSICTLLSHLVNVSPTCLGTVLHTKDCLNTTVSLLNPKIYHIHLPQLIYLRNKLWSETFKLLAILISFQIETEKIDHCREALQIITETIDDVGKEAFIETICESTKSADFNDLQNSALLSLSSLLGVESQRSQITSSSSMQNLLDTVRTPRSVDNFDLMEYTFAGAEICKILLNLYDLSNLKVSKDIVRKKSMIISTLSAILCVSQEAKKYAFKNGLLNTIIKQLKDFYVKLSLESVDCLKRVLDKKRVCPVLKELNELIGLITNFMIGDEIIKSKFAELGLSDFIHKLWVWFVLQKPCLTDVLKMMCTFTTDCSTACQSLPLTSSVAGSGPRKIPSKISLLHALINLIEKEMDQISKMHSLHILELSFIILKNCCTVIECRIIFCKSTLLHNISRLHPAITKKQKPWDCVELMWLEFLQIFSLYPEGQSCIAKVNDVFELVITLTNNNKLINKTTALLVLRNIAFYQPNRTRLLTSDDFLNVLQMKLENGNNEEKALVVLIMWALAANNQKAKVIFKAAQLDVKLRQVLKHYQVSRELVSSEEIDRIKYVLSIIRDEDKTL